VGTTEVVMAKPRVAAERIEEEAAAGVELSEMVADN